MDITEFKEEYREQLYDNFMKVYKKYVAKGIHVIIGKIGFINKNNTETRIKWGTCQMILLMY